MTRPGEDPARQPSGQAMIVDADDAHLTRQCEQAIRNYDPCICCATHFLDLTVDRA